MRPAGTAWGVVWKANVTGMVSLEKHSGQGLKASREGALSQVLAPDVSGAKREQKAHLGRLCMSSEAV